MPRASRERGAQFQSWQDRRHKPIQIEVQPVAGVAAQLPPGSCLLIGLPTASEVTVVTLESASGS